MVRTAVLAIWTVVLAIHKAVLVVYITVLNGTNSCVSDMDSIILCSVPRQNRAMNRTPLEHEEKRITPTCRAELEIGVGGDEEATERSEPPGEQVVQSARESAAHNAE